MNTSTRHYILTFGLVIANSFSLWEEAEAIISKAGKSGKRSSSAKNGIRSTRAVPAEDVLAYLQDEKGLTEKEAKSKVKAFADAAKTLNAHDILVDAGAPDRETLEALRLECKADLAREQAEKKAALEAAALAEKEAAAKFASAPGNAPTANAQPAKKAS